MRHEASWAAPVSPLAACTGLGLMFLAARIAFTQSIRHGASRSCIRRTLWHGVMNGSAMSPRAMGVSMMSSLMLMVFYVTWRTARPVAMGADARRKRRR
jgi:hypothetical protein